MNDIAVLIVLYNKSVLNSKSLMSILNSKVEINNLSITIWNNGPKHILDSDKLYLENCKYNVNLIESIDNISLSKIYNQFIYNNFVEKYVILDDDSEITDEYLHCWKNNNSDIQVPIITYRGMIKYPHVNAQLYSYDTKLNFGDKIISITSGVIINRNAINTINELFESPFDEKFYFYGVDTSFYERCYLSGLTINIIPGFEHELSSDMKESKEVKKFRCLEYSYAYGLFARNYPSRPRWQHLFAFIIRNIFSRSKYSTYHVVKAFITNKHYKN